MSRKKKHSSIGPTPNRLASSAPGSRRALADLVGAPSKWLTHERPTGVLPIDAKVLTDSLCSVATAAWRLRRSLAPIAGEPTSEVRRSLRHVSAIVDSLSEIGLTLQDHDDSPFNSGSSLSVLAFQPSPDLSIEKVIETLKPSIYFQGRLIQMGEVIVGTPELRPATEDPKDGDLK